MLEEEDAEQRRSQSGLWGKISQWSGINNQGREDYRKRDFAPDSPEIKFSDRREALELMTQIESTVTSLHREAEAQFRPELEKIVSGIETGFVARPCTPQKTLPVASMPAWRMRALP